LFFSADDIGTLVLLPIRFHYFIYRDNLSRP
jgi:hypothetical protein